MRLQVTRQQNDPERRIRKNGNKVRAVHRVTPAGVYCGTELADPVEYEGDPEEVTCHKCRRGAWTKICSDMNKVRT